LENNNREDLGEINKLSRKQPGNVALPLIRCEALDKIQLSSGEITTTLDTKRMEPVDPRDTENPIQEHFRGIWILPYIDDDT
jgi:hypothetical protein